MHSPRGRCGWQQALRRKTGRLVHPGQFARDLLLRPMTAQAFNDRAPQRRLCVRARHPPKCASIAAARLQAHLGRACLVIHCERSGFVAAAATFPVDCRTAESMLLGDRRAVELDLQQGLDRYPVCRSLVPEVDSTWPTPHGLLGLAVETSGRPAPPASAKSKRTRNHARTTSENAAKRSCPIPSTRQATARA